MTKVIASVNLSCLHHGLSETAKPCPLSNVLQRIELIRVNITIETDEDDLIGGFRLVNGDTVWHNGPVVEALERGCTSSRRDRPCGNKILCLQSVLEGKGVFLKKSEDTSNPRQVLMLLQLQILK